MPQSEDERREAARVRMSEKRARERAERDAAAAARANGANTAEPSTVMQDAVRDALAHMKWLVPSDVASRAQAEALARKIDAFDDAGDDAKSLSAHRALSRVLNDLGGTPLVRLQRELRSLKAAAASGDGDDERDSGEGAATGTAGGNVTRFERPAKRR